jgi:predicted lactoylglutathione lyase
MELDSFIAWAAEGAAGGMVSVIKPYDGKPATVGNGVMVALAAKSKAQVDSIHRKALELGAKDEGAPGPRGDGFYAGYFRDLDGHKLNAFFMG